MATKKATKKKSSKKQQPLDGIRVLDLSRLLPGPAATQMLANFGAQVIKIEEPGKGDYAREMEPFIGGLGAMFSAVNRGKKSVALSLTKKAGKEAFQLLVKKADVVVDGFRPGVMQKLGLDFDKLKKINPKLIYAAITGYGQEGLRAKVAGHDINYLAHTGALDLLSRKDGTPLMPGMQIADIAGGAHPAVIGILLALQARSLTGKGQLVDISMLDGVLGLVPEPLATYTATRRKPKRGNERLFGQYACYNVYPVRNGRFIAVGALEPKFWEALCKAIGRPDLVEDQFAEGDRQRILIAELTRSFQRKEAREWEEIFLDKDVCATVVRDIGEVAQDEQLMERGILVSSPRSEGGTYKEIGVYPKLTGTPGTRQGPAPQRGEHTTEVLRQAGLAVKKVEALVKSGAAEQWVAAPKEKSK